MTKRTSIFRLIALTLALVAGIASTPAALAHGGEDHGDGEAHVETGQPLAPRAEAASSDVEMLAVYDNKELTLFLSKFASNEPIAGAEVEIESGANKVAAKAVAEGMYKASAPWLEQPGKHGLVVTVQGQELADLLETTLEVHAADQRAEGSATADEGFASARLMGSLGGVVLIGLVAAGVIRRKK